MLQENDYLKGRGESGYATSPTQPPQKKEVYILYLTEIL